MVQVKERGGGGPGGEGVLVSFLARSKPKIPFYGLFLLRKQTETLATQASVPPFTRCAALNVIFSFKTEVFPSHSFSLH